MKIIHVITALGLGGAETQLVTLAVSMRDAGHDVKVISLIPGGQNAKVLKEHGIEVLDLGMTGNLSLPIAFFRLKTILANDKPDIVQAWLYHAEFLTSLVYFFNKSFRFFWNIRGSVLDKKDHSQFLFLIIRLLTVFSRFPTGIISNSNAGIDFHKKLGYKPSQWHLLYNAIDTNKFSPIAGSNIKLREDLGIDSSIPLIGAE